MVRVAVENISEEIRSLMGCMVNHWVKDSEDFVSNMTQTRAMCRARVPARVVNSKVFGGEENKLTFTYVRSTKMIQVQGSATFLAKAEDMLKEV